MTTEMVISLPEGQNSFIWTMLLFMIQIVNIFKNSLTAMR